MNGLSPLEERNGLSPERMRQRAAENASKIISARRLGATQTVRKSGPDGKVIQIFDARMVLLATVDIAGMSEGVVSEIERAAVQSPYTYQRQAIYQPGPVRKAGKRAPVIACYDANGILVGAVDPGDLSKTAKAGDQAQFNASKQVIGYANPKKMTPLRPLSSGAAKPRAAAKPAAPAAPTAGTVPTAEQVQKAQRLMRTPLGRPGSPSGSDITWAWDILNRHAKVRKAATGPAAPQGKLVYRYVGGKLVSKALER